MYKKSLLLTWKSYVLGMLLVLSPNSYAETDGYVTCPKEMLTSRDLVNFYLSAFGYVQNEILKMELDAKEIMSGFLLYHPDEDRFLSSDDEWKRMNKIFDRFPFYDKCLMNGSGNHNMAVKLYGKKIKYRVNNKIYEDMPVITMDADSGYITYKSLYRNTALRKLQDSMGYDTEKNAISIPGREYKKYYKWFEENGIK